MAGRGLCGQGFRRQRGTALAGTPVAGERCSCAPHRPRHTCCIEAFAVQEGDHSVETVQEPGLTASFHRHGGDGK